MAKKQDPWPLHLSLLASPPTATKSEGILDFSFLDGSLGLQKDFKRILIKAVFLVIKLYLPVNYVVNKPSAPTSWFQRSRVLIGTWRVVGWQGYWGQEAKKSNLVISSVDMSRAVCGCVACPAGPAGLLPAMKGLLFETLGMQSNKGPDRDSHCLQPHQLHEHSLLLGQGGRADRTCLVLHLVGNCAEKVRNETSYTQS